jgi:hypothetical protein
LKGGYEKKIMKKLLCVMTFVMLMFAVTPFVFGQASGSTGVSITPEDIVPRIWSCADRLVVDDSVNPGRSTTAGDLSDRVNNYAFEGEQIEWTVLVMNENGVTEIDQVVGTVDPLTQGVGGDIEVACQPVVGVPASLGGGTTIPASCNAQIDGNSLTGDTLDVTTQVFYTCTLTVETADSHQGEHFSTIEVFSGLDSDTADENEFWFFNPVVGLNVDGATAAGLLDFGTTRPGAVSYSNTITVENGAEAGSGVLLDMFVSGTDFFDPAIVGAACPTSNRLRLGDNFAESGDATEATGLIADLDDSCEINTGSTEVMDQFCYHATSGAFSTQDDPRADAEGYVPIVYGNAFEPTFYNDAEIIAGDPTDLISYGATDYYAGNVLSPGAEIAMTFKLGLPSPCVGTFTDGQIYFWGEVI